MWETRDTTDGRPRRRLAIALVSLAPLLAFVAVLAIWVDRQALNTDNWTRSSSQMLENPTVRNRVAEYLVEQLYANAQAGQVQEARRPAQVWADCRAGAPVQRAGVSAR